MLSHRLRFSPRATPGPRDPGTLKGRHRRRQHKYVEPETRKPAAGDHNPLKDMVGAAGIEPATPTMST